VGDDKVEEYCLTENIPVLLTIPLDIRIAGFYSQGQPLVTALPEWKKAFLDLFENIMEKSYVN
jgi:MinD superfamily P-loop ATPase